MVSGKVLSRLSLATALCFGVAHAQPTVVTSIKPIHSLVAAVMEGVGEPVLLIDSGTPHNYSLKPSQARALADADVVFWVGDELEAFLEKPLSTLSKDTQVISLFETKGLTKLEFRDGGFFEAHDHKEHDDHDSHAKHDHDSHKHDHDSHEHEHDHGEFDAHIWLDPNNASLIVENITAVLTELDPKNGPRYLANADNTRKRIDEMVVQIQQKVSDIDNTGFIVFHDAYQYFERRFGINAAGSITVSPEVIPGAKRISELRQKVKDAKATCVMSEPQFEPQIVQVITEGTSAKSGVMDPLGAELNEGPGLYFELMHTMANSLNNCLSR